MKKTVPDISYIVSAYNRPHLLPIALYSIAAQTHKDFEVIVTDNATSSAIAKRHRDAVAQMKDPRFRYVRTAGRIAVSDCYWSAEYAVKHLARGRWYLFPCDDTYVAPEFGARMLAAAYRYGWEFVICGQVVIGPDASGQSGYRVWEMSPAKATKTTFMVKASQFEGFAGKPGIPVAAAADYAFSASMATKLRWGVVPECMIVHN